MGLDIIKERYYNVLFGKNKDAPLDRRLFILITFVTAVITFYGDFINLFFGYDLSVTIVTTFALLMSTYFFLQARNSENHTKYVLPFLLVTIIILCIIYFLNGGYEGNTILLFFLYFIGLYSFVKETMKNIVFFTMFVLLTLLIIIQYYHPEFLLHHSSDYQRYTDILSGTLLYFIIFYSIVSIILKNYLSEHQKSIASNDQLLKLNEELKAKNDEILENHKLLSKNEERLRLILESSNDIIWDWDPKIDESYITPHYYSLLGYEPAEFKLNFSTWKNMVHPDDLPEILTFLNLEFFNKDDYYSYEFRMKHKSGNFIWFLARLKVVERGVDHSIKRIVGSFSDITKSKIAQQNLMESEERYRTLINTSPDGITVTDLQGRILFASNKQLEMLAYCNLEETKGKFIYDFLIPDEKEKAINNFRNFVSGKQNSDSSYTFVKKDGNLLYGQINSSIIKDIAGNSTGVVAITRDVTEKKQLEEQLQIRQRMDSIGTLAGGIAHDFNNLLTGITGYLGLLNRSKNLDEKQMKYISNMTLAGKRASELTGQLQSLTKSDITDVAPMDLFDIVTEVFNLLKKTTNRIVEKEINFNNSDFFVIGNPTELHQVFLNLGTNSYQSIEERGFKAGDYIKVKAEYCTPEESDKTGLENGEYVHIYFEDNGIGMTEEVMKKAFDPLFTTKAKGGGYRGQGLGLAMVYNIITRKHKGLINFDSVYGMGTTFHIYLPKAEITYKEEIELDENAYRGNETILIIEDEELLLNIATEILDNFGYQTIPALNGILGLELFRKNINNIDVVILDLTMPGMGGEDVIAEMLKIDPNVKIIICSGHSSRSEENGSQELSRAKGFIHKPYNIESFISKIRETLDVQ